MRNHSGTYAGISISDNATAMSAVVYKVIEDNDRAALKALVFPENVANANMKRFAAIDGKECGGY